MSDFLGYEDGPVELTAHVRCGEVGRLLDEDPELVGSGDTGTVQSGEFLCLWNSALSLPRLTKYQ